jgi:viroplasmin and RNaseH domain-containing protein
MPNWNFYAVARGRVPGIYRTCYEADRQCKGFSGFVSQGFMTESAARNGWMTGTEMIRRRLGQQLRCIASSRKPRCISPTSSPIRKSSTFNHRTKTGSGSP